MVDMADHVNDWGVSPDEMGDEYCPKEPTDGHCNCWYDDYKCCRCGDGTGSPYKDT